MNVPNEVAKLKNIEAFDRAIQEAEEDLAMGKIDVREFNERVKLAESTLLAVKTYLEAA